MIRFSCICSQIYEVADDQAGTSFQCQACHRLVEVPTLSELPTISSDGTYKMDADPEARTPEQQLERVHELQRAFTRHRTDEYGREIDLRPTNEEVRQCGTDEIPLELADQTKPGAPKYDPITGELIRPLDLKDDRAETGKGIWTGAPIPYSRQPLPFQGWQIIPSLLQVPNLAVMFGILCLHFFMQLMLFPMYLGFWVLILFYGALTFGLVAHYANIIEETGPNGSDELPRPMRDLEWGDDLWGPFSRFGVAYLLAYGWNLMAIYLPTAARPPFYLAVELFGAIVFPALLLTTTTSGSYHNLRPDRILRVIRSIGPAYILIVLGWLVGSTAYLVTWVASSLSFLHLFNKAMNVPYAWYLHPVITYPAFIVSLFLMHALMWYLGFQYRSHHHEFSWVLQSHTPDPDVPRRGFEVQRQRRMPRPVAAHPVVPIDPAIQPEETPAQAAARRERLLHQAGEETAPIRHGVPPRPPPDDHFDVDELLKP